MIFVELWTLVFVQSGTLVPGLDLGAEGMLFSTRDAADEEAIRQTDLYCETRKGERIRSEQVFVE